MLRSIKEQYADYISDAIQANDTLLTFQQWYDRKTKDVSGIFTISLFSEGMKGVVTIKLQADNIQAAREKARVKLLELEARYVLETGKNGQQLTPEQQLKALDSQVERRLAKIERERKREAQENKRIDLEVQKRLDKIAKSRA